MAEYASIPIINGLTDFSHPCQAMADYLTMLEFKGDVAGLKIAYRRRWQQRGPLADVCRGAVGRSRSGWRHRRV